MIDIDVCRASMDEAREDEREAVFEKLRKEAQFAHDAWVQSGHQKHARAVARHMAKVYSRITGREFVR